jgi:hypothetical protein
MAETVKVRIALVIDGSGHWIAAGAVDWVDGGWEHIMEQAGGYEEEASDVKYWITAEVPKPAPAPGLREIAAAVELADVSAKSET